MSQSEAPTIIVGAGFAGLFTALHLRQNHYSAPIVLVDRNDRFCFKPLLYEYFSGEMHPEQVMPQYSHLLQGSDIFFIQDSVESIDLDEQQVHFKSGYYRHYENLVLALGAVPAFFAEGAADHALTFQSKLDADRLKQQLCDRFEQATQTQDAEARRSLLTVAIVGGGPAGVELALTLGDLLPRWYNGDDKELRIVLLNRGEILEGDVNNLLRDTARKSMEQRPVAIELLLGASVSAIRADRVEYVRHNEPGELLAGTIVWTCGTQVNPLIQALPIVPQHRARRGHLHVTPTLQLVDYPNVFAAGDCAVVVSDADDAKPLPATAQVAYQQGAAIANVLKLQRQGLDATPAKVTLRGTLMKLGFGIAVANLFDRYEVSGKLGQTIRQLTYLELLPTPLHNFKTTGDWLKDEIFNHHTADHHELEYTAGYEPEELETLAAAVMVSGTAVSMAEMGVVSTLLETAVLGKELAGAPEKYPNNRVIQALFSHHAKRKKATQQLKKIELNPKNAISIAVEQIKAAIAILSEKATPDEIREYKEFIYACCDQVANAAGDGLLGRGQRVSPEETQALEMLKGALG
jgi:NADH dehydrogenase FAD-containing subunit